jgi:hypothetical protein
LPEYQTAHERNVYKTIAIVSNTKKLIQNINMQSLHDLRSLQKPETKVEEVLAAVIIIRKKILIFKQQVFYGNIETIKNLSKLLGLLEVLSKNRD